MQLLHKYKILKWLEYFWLHSKWNDHRKFYGQFEFLAGPWLWRRFPLFIRSFILLTHGSSVFVLKSFKISSNCLQKVFKISSNLQYPIQINFSSSVFFKFSISFSELSEDPSGAFSLAEGGTHAQKNSSLIFFEEIFQREKEREHYPGRG